MSAEEENAKASTLMINRHDYRRSNSLDSAVGLKSQTVKI